eukprot:2982995-Alexandrium_andersonii.AAC.1
MAPPVTVRVGNTSKRTRKEHLLHWRWWPLWVAPGSALSAEPPYSPASRDPARRDRCAPPG